MRRPLHEAKGCLLLVLLVSAPLAGVFWMMDGPGPTAWVVRVVAGLIAVASLLILVAVRAPADEAPDYLRRITRLPFERDGLAFGFRVAAVRRVAHVEAWFQNEYDTPRHARIGLRPARRFWLDRLPIKPLAFVVDCPASAFGVARCPIGVPEVCAGRRISFEVGVTVERPEGFGRRVRHGGGAFVRTNADFGNPVGAALEVAGTLTGAGVSRHTTVKLRMPTEAARDLTGRYRATGRIHWKPGDPPLEPAAFAADDPAARGDPG